MGINEFHQPGMIQSPGDGAEGEEGWQRGAKYDYVYFVRLRFNRVSHFWC